MLERVGWGIEPVITQPGEAKLCALVELYKLLGVQKINLVINSKIV